MEIEIVHNAVDRPQHNLQASANCQAFELSATTHQTGQEPHTHDKRRGMHEILHCEAASNLWRKVVEEEEELFEVGPLSVIFCGPDYAPSAHPAGGLSCAQVCSATDQAADSALIYTLA
jgi:hypothetical protein